MESQKGAWVKDGEGLPVTGLMGIFPEWNHPYNHLKPYIILRRVPVKEKLWTLVRACLDIFSWN